MVVVSRGRLLSKGSFPLIAGTPGRDLGGCLATDKKVTGGAPGVEFMDRPDGLAAGKFVAPAGCHGQRSGQAGPAPQAAAGSHERLNPGVEAGYQPGLPPVG